MIQIGKSLYNAQCRRPKGIPVGGQFSSCDGGYGGPGTVPAGSIYDDEESYLQEQELMGLSWYAALKGEKPINKSIDDLIKGTKREVSEGLASAIGLTEDVKFSENESDFIYPHEATGRVLRVWAKSSNDHDLRSLTLQEAAAEEFGIEMSPWQKGRVAIMRTERAQQLEEGKAVNYMNDRMTIDEYAFGSNPEMKGNTKKVLRAMYDKTQAEFKAAGITHLDLYRGMFIVEDHPSPLYEELARRRRNNESFTAKESFKVQGANVLESWSSNTDIADGFSGRGALGGTTVGGKVIGSITVRMRVPVERIVSTPGTGLGCLTEQEFVILPHKNDVVGVTSFAGG